MVSQEVVDLYDDMRQRSDRFQENLKLEATKALESRPRKEMSSVSALTISNIIALIWRNISGFPSIAMRSSLLSGILEPFQKAPNKASKKAVQDIG